MAAGNSGQVGRHGKGPEGRTARVGMRRSFSEQAMPRCLNSVTSMTPVRGRASVGQGAFKQRSNGALARLAQRAAGFAGCGIFHSSQSHCSPAQRRDRNRTRTSWYTHPERARRTGPTRARRASRLFPRAALTCLTMRRMPDLGSDLRCARSELPGVLALSWLCRNKVAWDNDSP